MPRLNVAPTKSNLLALKRQLAFAEEGYDLLEQKRRLIVLELMSRLTRARQVEKRVLELLASAFALLREAELDVGSAAIDRAGLGVQANHHLDVTIHRLMGIRVPRVVIHPEPFGPHFGIGDTSANMDQALRRFSELIHPLAELSEHQTAVCRLARELSKTQRRCNALTKIFMPNFRDTIAYILGTLEERERESLVILKAIRNRMQKC